MNQAEHGARIDVSESLHLSPYQLVDAKSLAAYLDDRDIYDQTLRIPYPYTIEHGLSFVAQTKRIERSVGYISQFAIRNAAGDLLGGCGYDGLIQDHTTEIGYWLAKRYWGQGIMTQVVDELCKYAFKQWNVVRITAHTFAANQGSARVLEKNGFEYEGLLRKLHKKHETFIDCRLYAKLR